MSNSIIEKLRVIADCPPKFERGVLLVAARNMEEMEAKQKALFETIAAGLKTQDKFQKQAVGRGQKIISMEAEEEKLLKVIKMAYRKHHLQDIAIGSDELSDELLDAICRLIGEADYQDWLNELDAETPKQQP